MTITVYKGDVVIKKARRFHAGLALGSHDLIGWNPFKISEDHLGKTIARFTSMEIKTINTAITKEQKNWKEAVNQAGGTSEIIYDENYALEILANEQHKV